jgi:hypothetical protein
MRRRALVPTLVVAAGLALAAAAFAHNPMPGMIGGFGVDVQTSVTPAQLATVRDRVERSLADSGYPRFRVAEVMAFERNDYVLVRDGAGRPAFELLADPNGRWLMPEPGPNMLWNTTYGMHQPLEPGSMTVGQAKARANAWLDRHLSGRSAGDATALPGYYTIDVVQSGRPVGMLSVRSATGAVWFHSWHGTFLGDRDF